MKDNKDRHLFAHDKPLIYNTGEILHPRKSSAAGNRLISAKKMKAVVMCSPRSRKPLRTFPSTAAAGDETGVNPSSISKVARGEQYSAGGYYWKWSKK